MRSLIGILFLFVAIFSSGEGIFVELDEEGVPSYSSHQTPGSNRVEIKTPITYSNPAAHINSQKKSEDQTVVELQKMNYSAKITHPPNDSVVRNNAGLLRLKVFIEPAPEKSHKAQLIRNGKAIRIINENGEIHLKNLDRGTHNFSIRIRNDSGGLIFDGTTTKITMLRHSIQN